MKYVRLLFVMLLSVAALRAHSNTDEEFDPNFIETDEEYYHPVETPREKWFRELGTPFGSDGKWNVERNIDHSMWWEMYKAEEMRRCY